VVEPDGADVLAGGRLTKPGHSIQGGGYGRDALTLLSDAIVDGFLTVTDAEAVTTARRLAREEGLLAGYSSGAVVAAALQLLERREAHVCVAVLLADSGLKYLSTGLWPELLT
jgi:cysteine synthase A